MAADISCSAGNQDRHVSQYTQDACDPVSLVQPKPTTLQGQQIAYISAKKLVAEAVCSSVCVGALWAYRRSRFELGERSRVGAGRLNIEPSVRDRPHLVVVDSYSGCREHVYDERGGERAGIGLPLAELAQRNQVRVTVLNWEDWLAYEQPGSFLDWMPFPATRPVEQRRVAATEHEFADSGIVVQSVPARDPAFGHPFSKGMSPLAYGLLADSDPLFLMSYVLNDHLEALHAKDPIAAVLLPMFGGLGYVPQLSRATRAGLAGVAFGVVVTDTSCRRQIANEEGLWTRPAITRRQMEDLSLALADAAICFGPRGEETARLGRSGGGLLRAPRRIRVGMAEALLRAAEQPDALPQKLNFFVDAPLQGSSGTLAILDAARLLRDRGIALDGPIECAGTNMVFGPAKPRDFEGYWSGRGWVRSLVETGYWRWSTGVRGDSEVLNVRVYPTHFDPLPTICEELVRGSFVLLSAGAAEGFAEPQILPALARLGEKPSAEEIADRLAALQALGGIEVDRLRREMCRAVAGCLTSNARGEELAMFCSGVSDLMAGRCATPRLGEVARLLLDRKVPLAAIPMRSEIEDSVQPTLTVAVTCYEMGGLVVETVESVWRSTRMPDEVILVDDGSTGEATLRAIAQLEAEAAKRALPLTVLRQENRGLADARNAALDAARSSYISFLDGDDLIGADFYRLAMNIFFESPELGGVAAWAEVFGDGVPDGFWNAPQAELPLLLVENTVIVPCVMPTELVRSLGGYDAGQRYNYEDWELAIRLLAVGRPIVTIPRYLQRYRVRADSLLRTMSDVQNQGMREKMFASHRELCAAFAPEVAMQIEHRLFLRTAAALAAKPVPGRWEVNARKAYARLRSLGGGTRSGVR